MTRQERPPLQAGDTYRTSEFDYFEFTPQAIQNKVSGEDFAILRIILKDSTTLEVPANMAVLHSLLKNLMAAYPHVGIEMAKSLEHKSSLNSTRGQQNIS